MIPARWRISIPLALIFVATTITPARAAENPLAKGQWAFEFAAELFNSDAASFIARRHFSKRSTLQLDAYLRMVGSESVQDVVDSDPSDTVRQADDETVHSHTLQLGASYVFYPKSEGKALLFLSGGAYYLRGKSTDNDSFTSTSLSTSGQGTFDSEAKIWGVGATGKIGFDWFFSPRLSLGSRYGVNLGYNHLDRDFDNNVVDNGNVFHRTRHAVEKTVSLDMTQLQLGISFYP